MCPSFSFAARAGEKDGQSGQKQAESGEVMEESGEGFFGKIKRKIFG